MHCRSDYGNGNHIPLLIRAYRHFSRHEHRGMHFLLERIDTYVSLTVALGYVQRIFLSLEYDDIGKHTAHLSVTIHFSLF